MAKAQAEANAADFKPMGFEGKARIKELRKIVETAVGCAFEENLFNVKKRRYFTRYVCVLLNKCLIIQHQCV